ncbi:MAG TPA: ribosome small subunit-dependent GTPase A [Clostridiaceae bacterium]|nr:ribosome small subunit-dependent GTPase A [Clostridiaceae bacterium]
MPLGLILKGIGGFYYVKSQEGIFECKARGVFRKDEIVPLPGDRVVFEILDSEKKTGVVRKIEPRFSYLERPKVANVNQIAIVLAARSPEPDFLLLDKLLITAESKKINPIIVVNKIDLDVCNVKEKVKECYNCLGYPVVALNSKTREGMDILNEMLENKITVLAGQSGVGKSTILNNIRDEWIMETGSISEKIERGKNTTRHAEIFELKNGGFLVDTPGFSLYDVNLIEYKDLGHYYPEFRDKLSECRFNGCSHISEPGCGVKEALENGSIDRGRYERYIEIYGSLKQQKKY